MSAKTSLLASRTRNDPCQILPGDSNSWGEAFLDNVDDVATWANNKKTKVLIISQLLDLDRNYVENELKRNEKTNNIRFHYYEMRDPNGIVHDQESFIHMFEEVGPTVVVLAYQHMIKGDVNNKLNPKHSGYAPPGSVAEILNSKKYFSKILLSHSNYLILRTSNVWHREECILTSLSPITKRGVEGQLEEARRSGLLENSPDSRVVIISGGHGYREKDGQVTSAGGESCFTNKDFLDLKFYEQDVKAIRELRKNPDFDKVFFEVVNIEDYGIYKSKPKQSKLSKLFSSTFRLDTSSSNTNSMYRQSSADKLVSYLTEFRPTFILISWCFSTNGDLAMALRSQGFFSKLLMEHDLRNITKDPEARLSDQQVEVLREAAATDPGGKKPKYKNFHLVGSSGCGKTILELEIGKIILAQICRDLQPGENVNVCIMVPKCMTKVPSELIKKLEDDLSFKDLVSAYAVNQKNVQLDYYYYNCDSIQQLSQIIKDEISEMSPAKYTVIIADEVTIKAEEVNGELVQDFTSLDRMEDNVWCVYAHSPVDESMIISNEIPFKIKLPLCTDVYTQHLHTRYRNNPEILQFLKFYAIENQTRTLVVDNDHDGARLPPRLAGSQHPVLWIDCNWSWMDIERSGDTQLTREMVHSLVPDMEIFNPNQNTPVGVMVVPFGKCITEEASQHWRWMHWGECAGLEEEIVVTFSLSFEVLSRARNQLIIVTGTDLLKVQRPVLIKAEGKNLLDKIVINDKPDAIIGAAVRSAVKPKNQKTTVTDEEVDDLLGNDDIVSVTHRLDTAMTNNEEDPQLPLFTQLIGLVNTHSTGGAGPAQGAAEARKQLKELDEAKKFDEAKKEDEAKKRLLNELKQIQSDPPEGVTCAPEVDNIMVWKAVIFGPDQTVFQDGIFQLTLEFNGQYPYKPPVVKFLSQMFHPNIDGDTGMMKLILMDNWSPARGVVDILMTLRFLLEEPNLSGVYVANAEAAKLFRENRREYKKKVQESVEKSWST